jgi:hypothetical protein
MLTEARMGQLSGRTIRGFACLQRPVVYEDGIDATELVSLSWTRRCAFRTLTSSNIQFPMKFQSDNANQSKLKRLGGDTRMFVR